MPDWRIEDYSVRVERTSFGAGLRRRISAGVLTFGDGLQRGEGRATLGLLTINFLGDAELPTSLGLRYTDSVGRPGLRLDMPLSEFEAVYHILCTWGRSDKNRSLPRSDHAGERDCREGMFRQEGLYPVYALLPASALPRRQHPLSQFFSRTEGSQATLRTLVRA